MTHETKCYLLAGAYLDKYPHLDTVDRIEELSDLIQQTIEGFIAREHDNYEPMDLPGWEGGFAENH